MSRWKNKFCVSPLCNLVSFVTNSTCILAPGDHLSPDAVSRLCSVLSCGAEVESLFLVSDILDPSSLAIAVRQNDTLRRLSVSCGNRAPGLVRMLAESFSPRLERLDISGVELTKTEAAAIARGFGRCTGLCHLGMHKCVMGSVQEILRGIGRLRGLESVYLTANDLQGDGVELLAKTLDQLPKMRELTIHWEKIRADGSAALGKLRGIGRLQVLDLYNDWLGDSEVEAISAGFLALSVCALRTLNLRSNSIGSSGGVKLADWIARCPCLTELDVSGNPIGSAAAVAIGKSLESSCSRNNLSVLDASECRIESAGVVALLSRMESLVSLTSLKLAQNSAGDTGAKAVSDFLLRSASGTKLMELNLGDNQIGESGAIELAKGLAKAGSLTEVELKGNLIGPAGGAAVLDSLALAGSQRINLVELQDCGIGDRGAEAMGRLLARRGCRTVGLK